MIDFWQATQACKWIEVDNQMTFKYKANLITDFWLLATMHWITYHQMFNSWLLWSDILKDLSRGKYYVPKWEIEAKLLGDFWLVL
jgi:hypothetical protein